MNTRPEAPDAVAVWDVLVREAGAQAGHAEYFSTRWPDCREYRFKGDLGFGGKVWWSGGSVYVTCYQEDQTPERLATIDRTNAALAALVAGTL